MKIELEQATVEWFQAQEKVFLGFVREATLEQAQRRFIGNALGKSVDRVWVGDTAIQVCLDEAALGREDLKALMDTVVVGPDGGDFYFYTISVESEDRGDDPTFGGVKRWIEVEFRLA